MSSSADDDSVPPAGRSSHNKRSSSNNNTTSNTAVPSGGAQLISSTNSNASSTHGGGGSAVERAIVRVTNVLDDVFASCSDDPKGSVHRAWGISLIFVLIYFTLSVIEMWNLHRSGSAALVIAAVVIALCHLVLGVLGTFVLKRFPTSFSIGFLLGIVIVLANQNLIFFGTFYRYDYGTSSTNHIFGLLGFMLAVVLFMFGILLFHFRNDIVVAPHDVKVNSSSNNRHQQSATTAGVNSNSNYVQYDDDDDYEEDGRT